MKGRSSALGLAIGAGIAIWIWLKWQDKGATAGKEPIPYPYGSGGGAPSPSAAIGDTSQGARAVGLSWWGPSLVGQKIENQIGTAVGGAISSVEQAAGAVNSWLSQHTGGFL